MPAHTASAASRVVAALGRGLAVAVVGAGLGTVLNGVRPDGVRPSRFAAPASCSVAGLPTPVEVLPPAAASALCGDPGVVIADARPAPRFAEGHIADAIHLPCAASGAAASDALARLVGKHTVVVYGDTTAEARSVADSLQAHGARDHLRVVVLDGGFRAWSEAGLACSSGPCPECADKSAPRSHEHVEARAP